MFWPSYAVFDRSLRAAETRRRRPPLSGKNHSRIVVSRPVSMFYEAMQQVQHLLPRGESLLLQMRGELRSKALSSFGTQECAQC